MNRTIALLSLALVLWPGAARAQVSAKASYVSTSVEDIPDGIGLELAASSMVNKRFGWIFSWSTHWHNGQAIGSACTGLIPPGVDCSVRPLDVEGKLEFVNLFVTLRAINQRGWTADIGVGPAKHKFEVSKEEKDTGRRAETRSDSWIRDLHQDLSLAATAVITRRNLFDRFGLQATVVGQRGDMKQCVADGYSLCDDYQLVRGALGLSYSFR